MASFSTNGSSTSPLWRKALIIGASHYWRPPVSRFLVPASLRSPALTVSNLLCMWFQWFFKIAMVTQGMMPMLADWYLSTEMNTWRKPCRHVPAIFYWFTQAWCHLTISDSSGDVHVWNSHHRSLIFLIMKTILCCNAWNHLIFHYNWRLVDMRSCASVQCLKARKLGGSIKYQSQTWDMNNIFEKQKLPV